MTRVLASEGLEAGEKRVGESLRLVSPLYSQACRHSVARMTNPGTYQADYFGQKLICAVDRFSCKVVGFTTMPIKTTTLFTGQCIYRYYVMHYKYNMCYMYCTYYHLMYIYVQVSVYYCLDRSSATMECGINSGLIRGSSGI